MIINTATKKALQLPPSPYLRTTSIILGLMLSLSYDLSSPRKFESPSSFLLGSQKSSTFLPEPEGSFTRAGLISSSTQTASSTVLIAAGGFLNDCTSLMSAGLIVSSAARADSRMGNASASASSHSVLILFAASADTWAFMTSSSTIFFLGSTTSIFSFLTTAMSSSVSATVLISTGLRSVSSFCMMATWSAVKDSFSRPTSYRFFALETSSRLTPKRFIKVVSSSRYDVGVT